ncbi:unnamed protein product [Peronospora destructor]|uniref:Uncharacterized protein n=1 Tax=Peronospora destructor TaxID=86335 RepID=A0AAV0UPS6_9STRA|nr:unnamed protein product [Peronospora destructor]
MIYPKTFRSIIALSTVAAASQASEASQHDSTNGAKRDKAGRYIDTTDVFGTTSASPSAYVTASTAKNQTGVKLRKVTSPDSAGVKFSYASPTNAVSAGNSRYVTVVGHSSLPKTLDDKNDKQSTKNDPPQHAPIK